ncbi:hypothetical protein D3C76_1410550 [compost metagenome]
MRHPPNVPQLGENLAANAVYRISHQAPASDLFRGVDTWVEQVTLAFTRDRRALGHDQAGAGALGVVQRGKCIGDIAR